MPFFLAVSFQGAAGIGGTLAKRSSSTSNSVAANSEAVFSLTAGLLSVNLKTAVLLLTTSDRIALSRRIVGSIANKQTAQGLKMLSKIRFNKSAQRRRPEVALGLQRYAMVP